MKADIIQTKHSRDLSLVIVRRLYQRNNPIFSHNSSQVVRVPGSVIQWKKSWTHTILMESLEDKHISSGNLPRSATKAGGLRSWMFSFSPKLYI